MCVTYDYLLGFGAPPECVTSAHDDPRPNPSLYFFRRGHGVPRVDSEGRRGEVAKRNVKRRSPIDWENRSIDTLAEERESTPEVPIERGYSALLSPRLPFLATIYLNLDAWNATPCAFRVSRTNDHGCAETNSYHAHRQTDSWVSDDDVQTRASKPETTHRISDLETKTLPIIKANRSTSIESSFALPAAVDLFLQARRPRPKSYGSFPGRACAFPKRRARFTKEEIARETSTSRSDGEEPEEQGKGEEA
ncbi:hypothetical protein EAG_11826 [Camponotus floridanus]|uniref:Uncharacterized protein n=1 Tax=Camponotus floridanus TaxID=104421 RepID=E2AA58_CAMFO|nr:hypothetical protein EAG_11826 [Camponotus floridanus]